MEVLANNGSASLTEAILSYLQEVQEQRALVARHEGSAAIHTASSKQLEVYRMFERNAETAQALRSAAEKLPSWENALYWKQEGGKWETIAREIEARMVKHSKLHPILSRGIVWNNRPMFVHAYKYEPDPRMKIELVLPSVPSPMPELPLRIIAEALQCHDYLVPEYTAKPLPPYEGHDANFLTLSEYLSQTMPTELYATQCFPLHRTIGSS
ncbi:MAG: hypothetical protein PHZ00_05960 [Candidatus Peribacteraceae bacterium]|nr:hypothetical protein [Candidatus Peribacteraceae bacterium]